MDHNENIIEGKTRSGIQFKVDRRIKEDARTLFYIRKLRKYKTETDKDTEKAEAAIDAVYSLLEVIFGTEEGLMLFMNEVAARHDGVAATAVLVDELNDIMEACDLKNS